MHKKEPTKERRSQSLSETMSTIDYEGLEGFPLYFVAILRAAAGLGGYATPSLMRQIAGFHHDPLPGNPAADTALTTMTRLFGVRDVVLGAAMVHRSVEVRRAAVLGAAIVDTADALAMGFQFANGELSPRAALIGFAGASAFAAINWFLLWRHNLRPCSTWRIEAQLK